MSAPTEQRVWILANPPTGPIQSDTFKLETRPLPELKDGELLVRIEDFSNDPAQRGWMSANQDPKRAYVPPVEKGDPVRATAIAVVVKSKSSKAKEGDRVTGSFGWYDYGVVREEQVTAPAVDLPNMTTASLSVLGMVSVTAYQGIFEILDVKPEHTVVVSGAAGAVGSVAIQLAKHVIGAKRVIGIAGGKEKCDWVVKHLGADACVDYKDSKFAANLKEAIGPDYADRYFENVGGDILNTMFTLVKRHGKIGICGMISGYNGQAPNLPNIFQVISNRLQIEGFLVLDMRGPKWIKAVQDLAKWIKEGKIKTDQAEHIVKAPLEKVPETWQMLFSGANRGKLITKLVSDSKL